MKHALKQVRPSSRQAFDYIEKRNEDQTNVAVNSGTFDVLRDIVRTLMANKRYRHPDMSQTSETLNTDMWLLLSAKAEGEVGDKLESCNQGEGLWAYLRIHMWLTLTTDRQSMRRAAVMQPAKCQHDHQIPAVVYRLGRNAEVSKTMTGK